METTQKVFRYSFFVLFLRILKEFHYFTSTDTGNHVFDGMLGIDSEQKYAECSMSLRR